MQTSGSDVAQQLQIKPVHNSDNASSHVMNEERKSFYPPRSYSGSKTDIQIVEHDHTLSDEETTLHQFISGIKTRIDNIYTADSTVKLSPNLFVVTLPSCKLTITRQIM